MIYPKIFADYEQLSEAVACHILDLIKSKPNATMVLTSGSTPVLAYQKLAEKATKGDFENVMIIGLDEWVGIPPENEGSCKYIVSKNLLEPLGISEKNFTFFDSMTKDLTAECTRIDQLIFERGKLDLMLVGLGLNGHIGLNEPGSSFSAFCQITKLDELTKTIGQKYFNSNTKLEYGITVGLKHLLESKTAMLMANGFGKAEAIKTTVQGQITENFPASIFQKHSNGLVWIDKEAASELNA